MTTEQAPSELTDKQIDEIRISLFGRYLSMRDTEQAFARAVIAADRALVASQAQPAAEQGEKIARLQAALDDWLYANGPNGWIEELRKKVEAATPPWAAEPRQDSVHAVESGGTTLPLGSEPGATAARDRELLAWAYSKLVYRSFDSMEDALAMDEIKLILMGAQ